MNLYLDDHFTEQELAGMLRSQGHAVVRPAEVGLRGASDARHLEHCIRHRLVPLTADRLDFYELHNLVQAAGGQHHGILIVRYDNDPKRDMKTKHIVRAVGKLEQSGTALINQVVILNHWR